MCRETSPSQQQERLYELKRSLEVTVSVAILTLFDFNLSFFGLLLNVENTVASQKNSFIVFLVSLSFYSLCCFASAVFFRRSLAYLTRIFDLNVDAEVSTKNMSQKFKTTTYCRYNKNLLEGVVSNV